MTIEPCSYSDLPPALVKQARREGADLDQTLKSDWLIFRARWGMDTVGFIGVLLAATPTIRGWFVADPFRGQGIGTRLLETAMDAAYQLSDRVEIRTNQHGIMQRFGFQWTGYERVGGKRERRYIRDMISG